MKYRKLGRTNLDVSEISIGLEWLQKKQQADVTAVIQVAIKNGVNYFDIIFNFEDFLKKVSAAIKGSRDKIILTHHLGSTEYQGKYKKSRSKKKCREYFDRFLEIMETDFVDILFIHFIHSYNKLAEIWKEGGIKDLALQLKAEGKAKYIGISTHDMKVAIEAAKSNLIDVIMIQINLSNHTQELRKEFLAISAKNNIGVVAMKPFAGGKLLQSNKKTTMPMYVTSNHKVPTKIIPECTTSHKCIHYVLSQIGISTLVPGVANLEELNDCLNYYNIREEQLDYSQLVKEFNEYIDGECVYCNHCQPCPADIDIGLVNKIYDQIEYGDIDTMQNAYNELAVQADECIECGDCLDRCPFNVKVIDRMKLISETFLK